MSQENVEIVRAGYERSSGLAAIPQDLFDPEIEIWESPELPGDLAGKGYDNLDRANECCLIRSMSGLPSRSGSSI